MNNILLIQFRHEPEILEQEVNCFVDKSGYGREVFSVKNALTDEITRADWEGADAVILGGSGDYLVSQNDIPEVMARMHDLLHELRAARKPTLGVCFGSQIMAHVFGGLVELDASRQETGAFEIEKLKAAEQCPVFSTLPERFDAMLGHKDHITNIPPDAVLLARSERSPSQAFTFPGEPMYAFLFHPELDRESITLRLRRYSENYSVDEEALAKISTSFDRDVRWSVEAYQRFFTMVAQQKKTYPVIAQVTAE